MEGYGHAQEILTRKVEVTSQAVNKWTSDFIGSDAPRQPLSPIHVPTGEIHPIHPQIPSGRPVSDHQGGSRTYIPKLSFPRFDGRHPKIWRDKCMDYFHICNVPEHMWVTTASLHLDDNAASWFQMYKLQKGG